MRPFHRYLLFQTPGWGVSAAIATGLHSLFGVPAQVAAGMVGVLVALDFALYPFFKHSYTARSQTGVESLVGQTCVAQTALHPTGVVMIHGVRWKARLADPCARTEAGEQAVILGVQGLTLMVANQPPDEA